MVCPFLGFFLPPGNGISPISPAARDKNQMGNLPLSDALKPFLGSARKCRAHPCHRPYLPTLPAPTFPLHSAREMFPGLSRSPHIFVGFGMCFLSVRMLGICGASGWFHHGNPAVASIKETPAPSKLGNSRVSPFYRVKGLDSAIIHFFPIGLRSRSWECFNGEKPEVAVSPKSDLLATHIPKENGVKWQLVFQISVSTGIWLFQCLVSPRPISIQT